MYTVLAPERFTRDIMNAGRGYYSHVQNPTKSELANGVYKPRLTITNRFNCSGRSEDTLTIELSLPKLVFGNNFDELEDSDFDRVIDLLSEKLKSMGIGLFRHLLVNAPVSFVHYSKNIPLIDGSTPYHYISKLKQANVSQWVDVNEANYRNDGHSYKIHSNSYEVIFYDKIKDLRSSKITDKRAFEKDTGGQLTLLDAFNNSTQFEVLRFEVRLNKRQKTAQILRSLGIERELTFQNLFSVKVSQAVLLKYLHAFEEQRPKILDYGAHTPKAFLTDLVARHPKESQSRILYKFGLKQALEAVTPRELRVLLGLQRKRSWYRLINEAKKMFNVHKTNTFEVIEKSLSEYKPLKLIDFQDRMINNDKYTTL
jgi:hypothetical protein